MGRQSPDNGVTSPIGRMHALAVWIVGHTTVCRLKDLRQAVLCQQAEQPGRSHACPHLMWCCARNEAIPWACCRIPRMHPVSWCCPIQWFWVCPGSLGRRASMSPSISLNLRAAAANQPPLPDSMLSASWAYDIPNLQCCLSLGPLCKCHDVSSKCGGWAPWGFASFRVTASAAREQSCKPFHITGSTGCEPSMHNLVKLTLCKRV